MVKRILEISTWVISAVGLIALLGFARIGHYSSPVTGLELEIVKEPEGGFLGYNQMHEEITTLVGANRTKSLGSLKVRNLQRQLELNPFVAHAEASTTLDRKVRVKLIERKPFVRIFTANNESYYIDNEYVIFPTHPEFVARVIIANGNISPLPIPENAVLPLSHLMNKQHSAFSIARVADEINRDDFMKVLIDQIFITEENTIEITPKIGDASVIVGDTSNIKNKIVTISAFFQSKSNDPALRNYSSIDARYRNQIVCTKRDSL